MSHIKVIKNPTAEQISEASDWPIWEKEPSDFAWHYDANETCYFLEGDVTVTAEDGKPVVMGKGDMVTFPMGMSCRWEIRSAVKKHYDFH